MRMLTVASVVFSGCTATGAEDQAPLTDARRTAIADTVQRLSQEASRIFDSEMDCAQIVQVLGPDAVYLVTSTVYTVHFKDGRTTKRPQVVTQVWSRRPEGWERVHLHESWRDTAGPSPLRRDSTVTG
jgi:ketosteroid isomerase-like protein